MASVGTGAGAGSWWGGAAPVTRVTVRGPEPSLWASTGLAPGNPGCLKASVDSAKESEYRRVKIELEGNGRRRE